MTTLRIYRDSWHGAIRARQSHPGNWVRALRVVIENRLRSAPSVSSSRGGGLRLEHRDRLSRSGD
jgi:hypothetical protein